MTNSGIQNGISAMDMFSQQKFNENRSVRTAFANLNSHFIGYSGNRNQTKRNPQPKLYHQSKYLRSVDRSFSLTLFRSRKRARSWHKPKKNRFYFHFQEFIESSLQTINEIATEKLGTKCASKTFHTLQVPLNTARYEGTRQKADLVSIILQDVGINHHGGKFKCGTNSFYLWWWWRWLLIGIWRVGGNFWAFGHLPNEHCS